MMEMCTQWPLGPLLLMELVQLGGGACGYSILLAAAVGRWARSSGYFNRLREGPALPLPGT